MAGDRIFQELRERGIPEHIALAFMDNFVAESGLDPTINERQPLVEGSRGGRGLYQLTGPRRASFEQRYGDDYSIEDQLDHMIWELENTEKRARDAIWAAPTRKDAVGEITRRFLRPAVDNSAHRYGAWRPSAGVADEPDEPEYADGWFGDMQRKRDEMKAGLREGLGMSEDTAEGLGGGLQKLGQQLMAGYY